VLAVDVSSWLRPETATSAGRLFCHVYGRGKGQAQMIPGWPYSVIAAPASHQGPAPQARRPAGPGRPGDLAGPAGHYHRDDPQVWHRRAAAWDKVHARLTHCAAWLEHDGPLPVIEGTLIRLQAGHLPGNRSPRPVWLWWSGTSALPAEVDWCWQAYLRRSCLEHTFRMFKQILGWTAPTIRDPAAADRRTWLIITVYAQLRLDRPLAADLRLPWERPARAAHPGLGPPRIPEHPRDPASPRQCAETRQTRTRAAARLPQPPPRTPPRHRQTTRRPRSLKAKRERTGKRQG
jgi:hypothetical protein